MFICRLLSQDSPSAPQSILAEILDFSPQDIYITCPPTILSTCLSIHAVAPFVLCAKSNVKQHMYVEKNAGRRSGSISP